MATMAEQLTAASDEATELNEEANDNIAENQAQHEMYLATYEALIKKLESGQSLTPEEQKMLENLVALMEELGLDITQLQEDTDEENPGRSIRISPGAQP